MEAEESSRSSHKLAWYTSKFSRLKVRNLVPVDNSCGHSRGSYTCLIRFSLFQRTIVELSTDRIFRKQYHLRITRIYYSYNKIIMNTNT